MQHAYHSTCTITLSVGTESLTVLLNQLQRNEYTEEALLKSGKECKICI